MLRCIAVIHTFISITLNSRVKQWLRATPFWKIKTKFWFSHDICWKCTKDGIRSNMYFTLNALVSSLYILLFTGETTSTYSILSLIDSDASLEVKQRFYLLFSSFNCYYWCSEAKTCSLQGSFRCNGFGFSICWSIVTVLLYLFEPWKS